MVAGLLVSATAAALPNTFIIAVAIPSCVAPMSYNGQHYAYAYRGYYWHGHPYFGYVPANYYASAYYGWAFTPWGARVAYSWAWGGAPWYRSYGYYFAPSPFYDSASLWLTDYLLAANLQAEYESRAQASAGGYASDAAAADGQAVITPEMKQLIADEVRAQIEAEKTESEAAPNNAEPDATRQQHAATGITERSRRGSRRARSVSQDLPRLHGSQRIHGRWHTMFLEPRRHPHAHPGHSGRQSDPQGGRDQQPAQ